MAVHARAIPLAMGSQAEGACVRSTLVRQQRTPTRPQAWCAPPSSDHAGGSSDAPVSLHRWISGTDGGYRCSTCFAQLGATRLPSRNGSTVVAIAGDMKIS